MPEIAGALGLPVARTLGWTINGQRAARHGRRFAGDPAHRPLRSSGQPLPDLRKFAARADAA